jgi:hypothetical protein
MALRRADSGAVTPSSVRKSFCLCFFRDKVNGVRKVASNTGANHFGRMIDRESRDRAPHAMRIANLGRRIKRIDKVHRA